MNIKEMLEMLNEERGMVAIVAGIAVLNLILSPVTWLAIAILVAAGWIC